MPIVAEARAGRPMEILLSAAEERNVDGSVRVDIRLLNGDTEARTFPLPERIQARLEADGDVSVVWLSRDAGTPSTLTVAAGGFARAAYRLDSSKDLALDGKAISVPAWTSQAVIISVGARETGSRVADAARDVSEPTPPVPEIAVPPSDRSAGNAFLANLSAYEPIYAVYGPGTDSEARIQISFKYQIFGTRRTAGLPQSWRDGLHFAYTQRMFWDLGAKSSPFRNIDYQPELFYLTPSTTLSSGISLSAQAGIRHESNGRDGAASRSINSVYVAPMAALPLGGGYRLSIAPRLSLYVGDKSDNPDIDRYRGNAGLFLEAGKDDGLRLTTFTRFNFSSGKGALSADLSYPLPRLLGGGPDFYLFGQSFVGYGENLLDYDRRLTRFRIGLALIR